MNLQAALFLEWLIHPRTDFKDTNIKTLEYPSLS